MGETPLHRLAATGPFGDLDADQLAVLGPGLRVRRLAAGQTLVEAGAQATEAFVVLDGMLAATVGEDGDGEARLAELGPGSVAGEIAVLTGGRRSATLRAAVDTEVACIEGDALAALLAARPEVGERLARQARERLDASRLARHLAALFPDMAPDAVADVAASAEWRALEGGEVLFRQGASADAAYVVVSGRLRVIAEHRERAPEPIAEVGAGELVGEAALLEDATRSATVVAARDTVLARFSREAFSTLVRRQPGALLPVAQTIIARSRDAMDPFRRARAGAVTVALVPMDAALGGEITALREPLLAAMPARSEPRWLSKDDLEREVGIDGDDGLAPGTPADLRLARWLDEAEDRCDVLVLVADADDTGWTRRCVRQADHLVFVADASADPAAADLDERLLGGRETGYQRTTLVLLHPAAASRPAGTAAWLRGRQFGQHLHVRRDAPDDLGRCARPGSRSTCARAPAWARRSRHSWRYRSRPTTSSASPSGSSTR